MDSNINDPSNLASLSLVVNEDKVNDKIDIQRAEVGEMRREAKSSNIIDETDPEKDFNDLMNEIRKYVDDEPNNNVDINNTDKFNTDKFNNDKFNNVDINNTDKFNNVNTDKFNNTNTDKFNDRFNNDNIDAVDISQFAGKERPPDLPTNNYRSQNENYGKNIFGSDINNNDQYITRTPQEQDELLMDRILQGDKDDVAYAIEQEHIKEQKSEFLDDIQNLRDELSMAKINLEGVPFVTIKSSIDDIREVHRLLRSKITFRRYHEIGREVIVTIAQSLEMIFNGQNNYFGITPDLRGWHLSVSHKLKRMKYETSALVRNVFKNNNINPFWQLIIELVPSAILHNSMRKEQMQMNSDINPGLCEQAYHNLDKF